VLSNQLVECNAEALDSSIGDLINISDLNEMSILHNLRIRYKQDLIYTNVSSILISVNPFKLLPLYTPAILDSYRQGIRDKPPHVFAIAHNAYSGMIDFSADQSVVISGESGAGKSEATKLILQFLTDVSSHTGSGGSNNAASEAAVAAANVSSQGSKRRSITGVGGGHLEQQILAANPILEAFGNAKTLRNNNSSRFGKLITVDFDSNGSIIGGRIINYLLEKSRVVGQTKGERNYHVFYQLLAAGDADEDLQERLKLQDAELFHYTGQSGVIHIEGVSDEKDYEEVMVRGLLIFNP
jgi:myosin heavy subunit